MSLRILRLPEVLARTGDSKSTIRRKEVAGLFPRRVKTGPNSIGWYEHELDRYLEGLPRVQLTGAEVEETGRARARGDRGRGDDFPGQAPTQEQLEAGARP
jgi:prophage regulatory protein